MVGIKATKFWHITPFKFFKRVIDDRVFAGDHPHDQRKKSDMLLLIALTIGFAKAFLYSYGMYEPKKIVCPGPEPPPPSGKKKKCQKKKGSHPCPEEDGLTVAPCPAETKLAEKKH